MAEKQKCDKYFPLTCAYVFTQNTFSCKKHDYVMLLSCHITKLTVSLQWSHIDLGIVKIKAERNKIHIYMEIMELESWRKTPLIKHGGVQIKPKPCS